MSILVRGLLSVDGQCRVAEDALNFCSGLVLMMVFTLIFLLKVPAHRLDKGFVIRKYFGTGTFECFRAMPIGQRFSKFLLWMDSHDCFFFDFGI